MKLSYRRRMSELMSDLTCALAVEFVHTFMVQYPSILIPFGEPNPRNGFDSRVDPFIIVLCSHFYSLAPEKKERQAVRSPRQSEGGKSRKRRQVSVLLSRE